MRRPWQFWRAPKKAPKSKHQAPGKSQTSNTQGTLPGAAFRVLFGAWDLMFLWSLYLGDWIFVQAFTTVNGPSKIVRLTTSVFATCGPWAMPRGAKKNA